MRLCARCGIDTDAANGVCRDCLDVEPSLRGKPRNPYPRKKYASDYLYSWERRQRNRLRTEEESFEIFNAFESGMRYADIARALNFDPETVRRKCRAMGLVR